MIEAPHFSPAGAKKSAGFSLPETLLRRHREPPGLHEAVKVYLANQRQGTARHQDPRFRLGRQPEAVEAEGHRPGPAGFDPRHRFGPAVVPCSVRSRATTASAFPAR